MLLEGEYTPSSILLQSIAINIVLIVVVVHQRVVVEDRSVVTPE